MGHLHLPHLPLLHHSKKEEVPKGCLPVTVGHEGEELERFVVPVVYFNHPLFEELLRVAEEEYGFKQKGTLRLPCHVAEFRNIQVLIDRETHVAGHGHHHHGHNHSHNPLVDCFRA